MPPITKEDGKEGRKEREKFQNSDKKKKKHLFK